MKVECIWGGGNKGICGVFVYGVYDCLWEYMEDVYQLLYPKSKFLLMGNESSGSDSDLVPDLEMLIKVRSKIKCTQQKFHSTQYCAPKHKNFLVIAHPPILMYIS